MSFHLGIKSASQIETPDEGRVAYFTDTDLLFKQKESNGQVTPLITPPSVIAFLQSQITELLSWRNDKTSITLSISNLETGFIDLPYKIREKSLILSLDRLMLHEGIDWTMGPVGLASTRIHFINHGDESLTAGSILFLAFVRKSN